jgi:hypothetical protein
MFGLDDVDTWKFLKVGWTQAWEQSLLYFPTSCSSIYGQNIIMNENHGIYHRHVLPDYLNEN